MLGTGLSANVSSVHTLPPTLDRLMWATNYDPEAIEAATADWEANNGKIKAKLTNRELSQGAAPGLELEESHNSRFGFHRRLIAC